GQTADTTIIQCANLTEVFQALEQAFAPDARGLCQPVVCRRLCGGLYIHDWASCKTSAAERPTMLRYSSGSVSPSLAKKRMQLFSSRFNCSRQDAWLQASRQPATPATADSPATIGVSPSQPSAN